MFVLGADPTVNAADLAQQLSPGAVDFGCELTLPTDPNGDLLDPTDVMVELTHAEVSYTVFEVSGPGACNDGLGWYLNDPVNPPHVVLCPETCADALSGDYETLVLWVGCA